MMLDNIFQQFVGLSVAVTNLPLKPPNKRVFTMATFDGL